MHFPSVPLTCFISHFLISFVLFRGSFVQLRDEERSTKLHERGHEQIRNSFAHEPELVLPRSRGRTVRLAGNGFSLNAVLVERISELPRDLPGTSTFNLMPLHHKYEFSVLQKCYRGG